MSQKVNKLLLRTQLRGKYNKITEDCDGETQRTVKTMFIS